MGARVSADGAAKRLGHELLYLREEDRVALADKVHAGDVVPRFVSRRSGEDGGGSMSETSVPFLLLGGRKVGEANGGRQLDKDLGAL